MALAPRPSAARCGLVWGTRTCCKGDPLLLLGTADHRVSACGFLACPWPRLGPKREPDPLSERRWWASSAGPRVHHRLVLPVSLQLHETLTTTTDPSLVGQGGVPTTHPRLPTRPADVQPWCPLQACPGPPSLPRAEEMGAQGMHASPPGPLSPLGPPPRDPPAP